VFDARGGDVSWNCPLQVATQRSEAEKRWSVELAVPWKDLGVVPQPGALLRGNFMRNNLANDKELTGKLFHVGRTSSVWAPIPDGFSNPASYGILVLQ
jgi:hypothetical protein